MEVQNATELAGFTKHCILCAFPSPPHPPARYGQPQGSFEILFRP